VKPKEFVGSLKELRFENVFNPYADRCAVHDVSDAPSRRSKMLLMFLEAATNVEIDALWIGRDLGHRGGRRTGLALTDDIHLTRHAARWNLCVERTTTGSIMAERTAAAIWSMLALVPTPIFLWNVFPLHPHEAGDPFSNRSHNKRERVAGEELLAELIVMLRPRRLIVIGMDAARTAAHLAANAEVVQVRHPSYGGQRDFVRQVRGLYDLKVEAQQLALM
jgi:hypothetical protein